MNVSIYTSILVLLRRNLVSVTIRFKMFIVWQEESFKLRTLQCDLGNTIKVCSRSSVLGSLVRKYGQSRSEPSIA